MFTEFERAIYQDPGVDYGKLWAKLSKEYWGFELDPQYADWDIDHFVMAPVYVQNYALGILIVEQIFDTLGNDYSSLSRKKLLGDKIREIWFHPGQEFDYRELTEKITGKKLTATSALKLIE
jgi:oligoendopeptidase F